MRASSPLQPLHLRTPSLQHLLVVAAFAKRRVLQMQAALGAQRRAYGLVEMIKAVSHEVELPAIITRIVSVAYDLLSADRVSVFLVDHDEKVRLLNSRVSA